jgi:hypothetical protein
MTPSQTIQLQALKLKATMEGSHPTLVDSILENPINKEELKKEFRNVCSLIHVQQFDELENLCSLLDLSKREVISMALNDFIPKANAIVSEVNPFEHAGEIERIQESK